MRSVLSGVSAAVLVLGACGAARAADAPAKAPEAHEVTEIIVTGTRVTGLRAVDSPAPIQVLDAATLNRAGPPDLIQTLALTVPSFNAQAIGGDMANETLAARLRGLSPNHTLVLIDGKRRHGTANLAILSSAFQGGASADLSLIPLASIDHIEVLQDGAAAQYGSDAIAGVVNIILKSASSGGSATASGGAYFKGDGETGALDFNLGLAPTPNSFLNLTGETRYHDFSNRGGPDQRIVQAVTSGAHPDWANLPGYPIVNKIFGDARYRLNLLSFNSGYDLGGETSLYAFGTFSRKDAGGWANFRAPNRLPQVYPNGFSPIDATREQDYAFTVGAKGEAGGWRWDLGSTYGKDNIRVNVTGSANIDLFTDTGSTPTNFHAGDFIAGQWSTTLDLTRQIDVGMAGPLNLAVGAEHRDETYQINAGDPASRYKAGSQSFPGFSLTDAGSHHRGENAIYFDTSVAPIQALTVDLAGRYEHFSDFGDTTVVKLTGRYEVSPALALRGTASTGFRAPTLAEEYYSATNVQPNSAFVQLPPNAAAAKLIGIDPLQPEKSVNFSLGLVAHPAPSMVLTFDVYQIAVKDRVVGSGTLYGTFGGVLKSPAVNAAIVANGNVLENVPFSGINVFTNGLDTRTQGAELVLTAPSDFGEAGRVDWSFAANYNTTQITAIRPTPAVIAASGQSLFDAVARSNLETASPKYKLVASGLYKRGRWSVNLRESLYGPSSRYQDPGDGNFYLDRIGQKFITDLDVSWQLTPHIRLSVGADNLFDVYPDHVNAAGLHASGLAGNPAIEVYPAFSPIGINGGYYYAKVRFTF
jgi:iron complex outermembrane receptor protein